MIIESMNAAENTDGDPIENKKFRAVYVKVDDKGNPIHIWNTTPGLEKQVIEHQYQLRQLLVNSHTQEQINIAAAISQKMERISEEEIQEILKAPFRSSCIDKDKNNKNGKDISHLTVGGAGIGWKAAIIALLRRELPILPTDIVHKIVSDMVNQLGGFSYHTDDVNHSCNHDQHHSTHKVKKDNPGCTHRLLLQTTPAAYGITIDDAEYLEAVKYPHNGHIKEIKRDIITRTNENDFTVVVMDYDETTEANTDTFYSIPNKVEVDGKVYKCYDYSRGLAHMVIRDRIIPALVEELHAKNINLEGLTESDLTNSLQNILDYHTQLTINTATTGKKTVHIVPARKTLK